MAKAGAKECRKKKMSAVCHLSPPRLGDLWLLRGDRPSHKPFHYCLLLEEYICMYAYLPTYLSILVCTYTFDTRFSLYIGAIVGLGFSIYYVSPIYISLYTCMSIVCVAFKSRY